MSKKKEKKSIKKLNDYIVMGIKRQEHRGDGKTLHEDYIKAKNPDIAFEKFNEKHPAYKAVSLKKLAMG